MNGRDTRDKGEYYADQGLNDGGRYRDARCEEVRRGHKRESSNCDKERILHQYINLLVTAFSMQDTICASSELSAGTAFPQAVAPARQINRLGL
jgi:hypothetical protein